MGRRTRRVSPYPNHEEEPYYEDIPVPNVGSVGWQDETEPRKRPKKKKEKPFPFGFTAPK